MQACQNYEIAWSLRNNSHACAYNWGVALSDLAKHHRLLGNLQEAETEMLDAAHQYAVSLKWNPNNPQVCPEDILLLLQCLQVLNFKASTLIQLHLCSMIRLHSCRHDDVCTSWKHPAF
jgi:hypothetical protein